MVIDMTSPIGRIRVKVGDTADVPILPDNVYEFYFKENKENEKATVREVAYVILGVLSQNTRQRLDRIETFGQQAFDQYLKFIQQVINNPTTVLTTSGGYFGGYVGGISKSDFTKNLTNRDNIVTDMPPNAWGR